MIPFVKYVLIWLGLGTLVGILAGSASAGFLALLDWATQTRDSHLWLLAFLPLAGFGIGYVYHHYGANSVKGNNLLLEELYQSKSPIPLRMTPLVLLGLFSPIFWRFGRTGRYRCPNGRIPCRSTDEVVFPGFRSSKNYLDLRGSRGICLCFGTPLAGAIFSLEWMLNRKFRPKSIFPAFWAAFVGHWVCELGWGIGHTAYSIPEIAPHTLTNLLWIIPAGIAFGLAARLFAETGHGVAEVFKKYIAYPPLRPVFGGIFGSFYCLFHGGIYVHRTGSSEDC